MKNKIKKFCLATALLFGFFIIILTGLLAYLKTDHAQRLIQSKINAAIPGKIAWQSLQFSLLKGTFELSNLILTAPTEEKVAGVEKLSLDIAWSTLLQGDFTVRSLIISRPWAALRADAENRLNLLQAFPTASPPKLTPEKEAPPEKAFSLPVNIVIQEFRLEQGAVSFEKPAAKQKVEAAGISIAAHGNFLQQTAALAFQIGRLNLDTPQAHTSFDTFRLQGTLREGNLEPLVFETATAASRLVLEGKISEIFSKPLLNLAINLKSDLAEASRILNLPLKFSGLLQSDFTILGTLDNPDANLKLQYGGGLLAGNKVARIDLDCRLQDRFITLANLVLKAASGEVNLQGKADLQPVFPQGFLSSQKDLEAITYNLVLQASGLKLEEIAPLKEQFSGIAQAALKIAGRGVSPRTLSASGNMDFKAENLKSIHAPAPVTITIKAETALQEGLAAIKTLSAEAGKAMLRGEGHFNLASEEIGGTFKLNVPNLTETLLSLGLKEISGNALELQTALSGFLKKPVFDFQLMAEKLKYNTITIGDIQAQTALDRSGKLTVSSIALQNGDSSAVITGQARLFDAQTMQPLANPAFEIKVTGETLNIEDFVSDIKGTCFLKADISGSLQKPAGTIRLNGKNFELGVQSIEEIQLSADLANDRLNITTLQVAPVRDEIIEGQGWISRNKAYDIELMSKGISLNSIDKLKEQEFAEGLIAFSIKGKGTLEDPNLHADITLSRLQLNGKDVDDFTLQADIKDQVAKLAGKLNFDVEGSYHLKKKDFSASMRFRETDLSPYFRIAEQPDFKGNISGIVEARGNADTIQNIEGRAELSGLTILYKDKEVIQSQDFTALLENDELKIPLIRLILLKEGKIDIQGQGKLSGSLALGATGNIPLRVANVFVQDPPDISGNLLLKADVSGTVTNPLVQADLTFQNIGLTVPALMQKLHDLNGTIKLTPRNISISGLEGYLDTGRFEGSGTVDLDNYRPTRIAAQLKAHALPVHVPETMDMLLNAAIEVKGTEDKSAVQGDITILEGLYYKDINLSPLQLLTQKKRAEAPPPREVAVPFLKNMETNIAVKRREPFIVNNNMADLTLSPDLRITGNLNNPVIIGRAAVDSGTITYQKKPFTVKKGVIDFVNPYKIEPDIDIEATVSVRNWTIDLDISGTPDALVFKLTSDPAEEDGDIISLLLFGKTTRELIKGEGGTSLSTSQLVAELLASTFGEDIKKATGLDIFEVEATENSNGQPSDGIKVTIGKELSRRMTVKYAMETKDGELIQRAIAEYKLLENLLVNAFQDTKGSFGGSLQYRMEFR